MKYQLDHICEQMTEREILGALEKLPETLHGHYDRVVGLIAKQSKTVRDIARRVIECLSCCARRLSTFELLEAIALEESTKSLSDLDIIPNPERIVQACHNLVAIGSDCTVSFSHYSVQEYFVSDHLRCFPDLNLRYFSMDLAKIHFRMGLICLISLGLETGNFTQYAEIYFPGHVSDRFTRERNISQIVQLFCASFSPTLAEIHIDEYSTAAHSPVQFAAQLGLGHILRGIIESSDPSMDDLERALRLASNARHEHIVQILLAKDVHLGVASPRLGSAAAPLDPFRSTANTDTGGSVQVSDCSMASIFGNSEIEQLGAWYPLFNTDSHGSSSS